MTEIIKTRREVTLPAATFVALLGAARARGDELLREQGVAAGRALAERLRSSHDSADSMRALPLALFWKRVNELFTSRGWGSLTHEHTAPGVAELRSTDWIEADHAEPGHTCAFTAGMIQGLLSAVSGGTVEVRESECRADGAHACRFVFGAAAALDAAAASVPNA